jgi:hypothetical protein
LFSTCTQPEKDAVEDKTEVKKLSAEFEQLILDKEIDALNSLAEGSVTGFTKNFDDSDTYIDDLGAQNRIDGLPAMHVFAENWIARE